jgi:hypothetical protein
MICYRENSVRKDILPLKEKKIYYSSVNMVAVPIIVAGGRSAQSGNSSFASLSSMESAMFMSILENIDLIVMGCPLVALLTAGAIALVYADDNSTVYQHAAWSKWVAGADAIGHNDATKRNIV